MKYVSIDIETLGLNIDAPIIEVACVFVDNGNIVGTAQTYVKHFRYDNCEPYAMAMHPELLKKVAAEGDDCIEIGYLAQLIAHWCQLHEFDPKITFAGKNAAGFDLPMLNHQTGGKFNALVRPHHRVLDPGPMFAKRGDKSTPNLNDIIEQEKLDVQVTHTALDDALAVVAAVERFFDLQDRARDDRERLEDVDSLAFENDLNS